MYPGSKDPIAFKLIVDRQSPIVIPCFRRKLAKGLIYRYECSPGGLYSGPLGLHEGLNKSLIQLIQNALIKEFKDFSFRTNPFLTPDDSEDFISDLFTQVVDLRNQDEISAFLQNSGVSYDARSAQRKGLKVTSSDSSGLAKFFEVYKSIRRKWDNPTSNYPFEFFQRLISSNNCDFWSVTRNDDYIGGGIVLKGPFHASSWLTIMHPDSTNLRPYEFIYQYLIEFYSNAGLHWFDFNPSAGLEGVVKFKEKFGTVRIPFYQFENQGMVSSIINTIRGTMP